MGLVLPLGKVLVVTIHLNKKYNMCDYSKFISNIVITPYCKERKELLKMALRRMLYQAPIMEESVADIFTENPYPCPF